MYFHSFHHGFESSNLGNLAYRWKFISRSTEISTFDLSGYTFIALGIDVSISGSPSTLLRFQNISIFPIYLISQNKINAAYISDGINKVRAYSAGNNNVTFNVETGTAGYFVYAI